jgi:plasmid stability protein
MKTTLELPDTLLRRAKATAAKHGQTMTAFVKSALEAKLTNDERSANEKPWMQFHGIISDHDESGSILKTIEESCGQVDQEDWK